MIYFYKKEKNGGAAFLRIAICDDNKEFLRKTKELIENSKAFSFGIEAEIFEDGDTLIRSHFAAPFDIIILDVIMPLLNGIETAREIRQQDKGVKIVFLTSSTEFAVDSYEVKASNYLIKPVENEKLFNCIEELAEELHEKEESIIIKNGSVFHRVEICNIEYVEAQNKHVVFTLADGSKIESLEPLYAYEYVLLQKNGFFKCNRSYIVNMKRIHSFDQKEITMFSGNHISVSRNSQKNFKEAYFEHLFGKAGEK